MSVSAGPPVVVGSSMSGLLVSLSLSRAGIDHVMVGGPPPAPIPRLGESINDTASPELWRLFGREMPQHFHYKNHICYFHGNFTTMIYLANPRRSPRRVLQFAPTKGMPRYPWFGEALFHLDRIGFDRDIYAKAIAEPRCRFTEGRAEIVYDPDGDRIERVTIAGGDSIERPAYVFDTAGFASPVAKAAKVATRATSPPQRIVFTHYRRETLDAERPDFWRHGTNLVRLDQEFDGIDAMAWVIPIGTTLSVGMSMSQGEPHFDDDKDALLARLDDACRRRGIDYRPIYPDAAETQELRMSYYVRERAFGANWLLVGGSFISTWFPGSAGMWTVTAAASMAPRLTREPALGHFYERAMRGLLKFHDLLGTAILGPPWRSSLQVYRFFSRGTNFIFQRVNWYLRIKNERFGWFRPVSWLLELFNVLSTVLPTIFFVLAGGMALVRSRLEPDRRRLGRNFLAYFHMIPCRMVNFARSIPQFLWAIVPRRPRGAIGPPRAKAQLPRADAAAGSSAIGTNSAR